jgi:hypothetical protein
LHIAEELHFDLLETRAAAAFALALTGIETEGAGRQAALSGRVSLGVEFTQFVEGAHVDGWIGPGRAAQGGLINQEYAGEMCSARDTRLGVGGMFREAVRCFWIGRFFSGGRRIDDRFLQENFQGGQEFFAGQSGFAGSTDPG